MHGYVIFDNNVYKRAGSARMDRIRAAEQNHGVVALAHVVVIQELLARVRDKDAEMRGMNRAAVKKLVRHCCTVGPHEIQLHFVTHLDGQVFRRLTGENPPDAEELFANFRELARVVAESDRDAPLAEIAGSLDAIEKHVEVKEREYVGQLEAMAKAPIETNQMKRNLDYAYKLATRALSTYGRTLDSVRVVQLIVPIAQVSSVTFALRDHVIQEVRAKGGGHQQHRNTIWDEEIVASTSIYSTIRGKPVVLVTTEARLVAAAATANAGDRVVDLDTYESVIGLDPWSG